MRFYTYRHKNIDKKKIIRLLPARFKKQLPKNIAIIAVGEKESGELNRRYRGRNKPANVLSFRYGPDYGEIVLCPALIRREARQAGNSYRFQRNWMLIHGLLHLAGLHHEKSSKTRKKFEKLEDKLLNY